MDQRMDIPPQARADDPKLDDLRDDGTREVLRDLAYKRLAIVNVAFYGLRGSRDWVLIDAGVHGSAGSIEEAARERFGCPPSRLCSRMVTSIMSARWRRSQRSGTFRSSP